MTQAPIVPMTPANQPMRGGAVSLTEAVAAGRSRPSIISRGGRRTPCHAVGGGATSGPRVQPFLPERERVVDRGGLPVGRWRESPAPDELEEAPLHRQPVERRALHARGPYRAVSGDDDAH